MCVIPDMGAGAVAAADSFPSPKSAIGPPLASAGRQGGVRHHESVEQPMRQGAVVIRIMKQASEFSEALQIVFQVFRHIQSIFEKPLTIGLAMFILGEVPGN